MTTGPRARGLHRSRLIRRAALIGGVLALALAGRAEAQFGFGHGFGFGIYARPYTPPSVKMLNRVAATRAGMDQEALNRTSQSAPDRYAYRERQVALQQRYDIESGRSLSSNYGPRSVPISREAQNRREAQRARAEARGPSRRVEPITQFVNEQNQVVWPADAPVSGELGSLRDQADQEIQEVAVEYRATNSSSIDTVADARQALLDYGRPALQFVRENSTAAVADTFHVFLLSLYESLAQAARDGGRSSPSNGPPPID